MNGWIGVDLDSTLAYYDEWRGVDHIGPPIPAMVERVRDWLAQGHDVRIFTARVSSREADELDRATDVIQNWCAEHIGYVIPITNVKDYGMISLFDDRCIQVEANTGRLIGE